MSDQPVDPSSNWAAPLSLGLAFFLVSFLASTATAIDEGYHYLWANQTLARWYEPDPNFAHHGMGSTTYVRRLDVGRYDILWGSGNFPFLLGNDIPRNVTAYGITSDQCMIDKVDFFRVACFDAAGNPKDTRYTASLVGGPFHASSFAAVFAWQHTNPSYNPPWYNAGQDLSNPALVTRTGTGNYHVSFPNFSGVGTGGGNVQVTAELNEGETEGHRCTVLNWASDSVNVRCFDPAGAQTDTPFWLIFQRADPDLEAVAFAWADDETSASYIPNPTYSHNSAGGAITATRSSTGVYTMTFAGMGSRGINEGTVQVTAYAGVDHRCKVASWVGDEVNVRCFDTAGDPVDSRYTVAYRKAIRRLLTEWFAASYVPSTGGGVTPNLYWNRHADAFGESDVIHTRLSTGVYTVEFVGMSGIGSDGGNAQVTAVESLATAGNYCNIESWFLDIVTVRCFGPAGNLADTSFHVVLFQPYDDNEQLGYLYAGSPSSASSTPSAFYSHNPSGGAIEITRLNVGQYRATFTGISAFGADDGAPIVSAYGTGPERCKLLFWNGDDVDVLCVSPDGTPTDNSFSLIWFRADGDSDGFAYSYADLESNIVPYAPLPAKSYNPAHQPIEIDRGLSPGSYSTRWEKYEEHGVAEYIVLASAVGTDTTTCAAAGSGDEVGTFCRDASGVLTDSKFVVVNIVPLALPEPSQAMQCVAGLMGLIAMARYRVRNARPADTASATAKSSQMPGASSGTAVVRIITIVPRSLFVPATTTTLVMTTSL